MTLLAPFIMNNLILFMKEIFQYSLSQCNLLTVK